MSDEIFMQRALELARQARTKEEVPIGAVLVKDGKILTEGANEVETRQDATAHAEMLAIAEAQALLKTWRLTGTTLYVTKEPCPMCAGALAHVRVDRIVFGIGDPKAGACGGAFQLFDLPGLNHRCEITPGVLATESLSLLQDFSANAVRKVPLHQRSERALYETHFPVSDPQKSAAFYRDVVGLSIGLDDVARNIVFMLVGDDRNSMLGLWGAGSEYGAPLTPHHFAFEVSEAQLLQRIEKLNQLGIVTTDFFVNVTNEPTVMGWGQTTASIYFPDPDGHSVEFIAILSKAPSARAMTLFSEWKTVN